MGMFDDLMPSAPAGTGMFDDLPPAKPSGALRRGIADKALGFASGAVGATKALADVAGAGNVVSNTLDAANKGINEYLSPEAKADQQEQAALMDSAKGQGTWEGVKAGAKAFAVAPVQTAVQGLGSIVPIIAGTAMTGGAAPAAAVGAGIGAAMGAGTAKGAIYDEIKKRGGTEEEATKAQEYGGANTDQIALGGVLGTADALTGVSKMAGNMVRGALKKPVTELATQTVGKAAERGVFGRAGMGMLSEMPLEAAQGGQEQVAANLAAQRAGYEAGTWDNVASNATLESLASAGPGAAFGAVNTPNATVQPPPEQPPAVPPEQPEANAPLALPPPNIIVGPDGTATTAQDRNARLARIQSGDITDVTPIVKPPEPIVPEAIQLAAQAGGALSGAAETAFKTGAVQQIIDQQTSEADQAAYDAYMAEQGNKGDIVEQRIQQYHEETAALLAQQARENYDNAIVESLDAQDEYPGETIQALNQLDDADIPDIFATHGNASDEDFLRAMGATDQEIADAITSQPSSPQASVTSLASSTQDDATGEGTGAGNAQTAGLSNAATDGVQPLPATSSGQDGNQPTGSVESGATDGNGVGADTGGREADPVVQFGELPTEVPVNAVNRPTTAQRKANLARLKEKMMAGRKPKSNPVEAPAAGNASTTDNVPGAGSAKVEGDGIEPKAKWLKAINDQNRLAGDTGVQLTVQNGKLTFLGSPDSTKQGKALQATLAEAQKAGATVAEIIASIQASKKPAPGPASLGSAKADMDHLFGIDQKREKAIARIAKGTAYFGNALKAGEFLAKNGLRETHKAVKTDRGFDIVANEIIKESSTTKPERENRIASILSNGGHVVGSDLRDRNGMRLMGLTPEELATIPADKVRAKPSAEAARTDSTTKGNEDGTQAPETQQAAAPAANTGAAGGRGVQATGVKPKKPSLRQRIEDGRKARADYFTPGNIVQGYSGYERVISYKAPDDKGEGWNVTVQAVVKQDGEWVVDPEDTRIRTHSTHPEAKALKDGPVERVAMKSADDVRNMQTANAPAKPEIVVDKAEMRPYRKPDGSVGYEAVPIVEDKQEAEKPGTVNVPPTVAEAFTAQMQKQKGRITRLKNEAEKAGSLEDKRSAQLKVTAAEATLRQMRLKIFDAEDAAVKAIDTGDAKQFSEYADLFPGAADEVAKLTGQNDELDAEMQSYEAKKNPTYSGEENKPLAPANTAQPATESVAKPGVKANTIFTEDAAAAARARLKSKLNQLNSGIDPEMMMDGITLAGYHMEKGARTFAAFARAMVDDLGDSVKPYLKSWYSALRYDPRASGFTAGMSSAAMVDEFDMNDVAPSSDTSQLENSADKADTATKDEENATRKLDSTSPVALEGIPANQVQGTGKVGPTEQGADGSSGPDAAGNGNADGAGLQVRGGVGNGAGGIPVSSGGKRSKRGSAGQSGVSGNATSQSGFEFIDTSGGTGGLIPVNPAPNAAPIAAPAFSDFTIDEDFALGEGGPKAKFQGNIAAIRLLKQLDAEGRMANPSEQAILAKYVGWGGLAQAFDSNNADWSKEYAELKGLMSVDDYADARVSTRYAHFTSRQVVQDGIYAALQHMGFNGGRALEGGAGVGNFIGLMPAAMRSASRFTAIEREPFSAKIARNLYPQQNIQEADFTEFVGNDDFYDVAVGNPPFASDPQVDRSGRKHLSGLSLHNYFFAKEVDMLREGGILAQVITNSFMDAQTDTARKYIAEKTKLLGAIRLPNNAFSKNANTEVTTDLIFLQKLPESEWGGKAAKANAKTWLGVGEITDAEGRKVALNQYFIDHPEMMLGKFGAYGTMYRGESPALVQKPGQDTAALLKEAVSKLPANVYVDRAINNTASMQDTLIKTLQNPQVQEGGYFEEDGKLFQRIKDIAGEARGEEITPNSQWTEKTKLGEAGFNRIKSLSAMRSTVRSLLAAELANDPQMEALRKTLNEQYDAYDKDFGRINDPGSMRVFGDDPDFPLLSSLEYSYTPAIGLAAAKSLGIKMVPSSATKGPIFTRRVIDARQQVAKVESPADALNVSMAERGKLDTQYIGELLGKDAEDALHELSSGDHPLLFNDPATGEFVLRDAYLSGNVRAKLVQAKQAGMFNNIKALEAVQPEDIGAHEIVARIGSPWVPEAVYQDFAKALFGDGTDASIRYVKESGGYSSYIHAGNEIANTNTWGTPDYRGSDILAALLNNKPIKVTDKDADGKTYTVVSATENANAKAQEIRDKFQDWLFSDADRAELLGRAYNDTNNNYVTRQYDGAWMTFPGKVPNAVVEFRRHQRNAIARVVQDRTALLDHVVGSGKTYTIIASAMELRRTGLAKKPMIAVPNHLVKQWAADFYKLYPGANILTATKKDFEKTNRRKFLAKIATGDWDAVIIAHSSYGFIKPAPDFEEKFNTQQVEAIVKTINEVENGDGDKQQKKRTVKQLEGIKERLENRIKALRDKPMDALLDFGELGVDQLFVDEAHLFKNLMFSTKMQNIAGLGDSKGSQRAYDMFVKANQLYEKNGRGQGVVFATGTPVSNSLAEMYHMMRYLMPQQMEDMGFQSFDAWANTFASVEQVWMQKASADGFKAQNRMSNFVNTPELLKIFDQVSDTVTMDDVKKAFSEENGGREFPLPVLKDGKRTPVSLRKSQAQEQYMSEIASRALALEQRKGPPQKGEDNILVIMSDARKAAMDVRLVDHTITEREAGGRIDRSSQEIHARYKKFDSVKGTQLVFSDLGTPLKAAKKELAEYQALKERIEAGQGDEVLSRAALGDEAAQAKIDDSEDAQEELDAKGRDWLGAMQAAERGFSVYDDLKAALVEKGIPENEIAFIHDYNTDEQKAGLFRKVNSGQIRVLLGSTQKLGAGTNVQERLVALHHLDVPWKPSDVEQREGRIIRQGNKLSPIEGQQGGIPGFEVEILAYVTQDTLDMRMWQVQETKLKMINQLRTRKIGRDVENAFEDMELSAGEMQAAATGNVDLLREIQIKGEIKKLEQRKRAFDAQKSDLQNRKKSVAQKLESLPARIESSKGMAEASDLYRKELSEQSDNFKATIDGKEYTDAKEAGALLLGKIDAKVFMQRQEDGKYGGRQLTQEQADQEPKQDPKAEDYNPWVARPVPLDVNLNGEVFKSRDKLAEAFSNLRGDRDPISWKFDGQQFNRRTQIDSAIRQSIAEAISEKEIRQVGSIGPFNVAVEGQTGRSGDFIEVTLSHAGQTISNSAGISDREIGQGVNAVDKLAPVVSRMAENLAVSARQQHEYEKRQLEQAKKEKAELDKAEVLAEWPNQGKLEELRKKHQEVLRNLAGAGIQVTADGEALEGSMGLTDTVGNETDVVFSRPRFSRGAQSQANESVERLATGIASHWENAPKIVVAFDMDDPAIPESVRKEDQRQRSGGATGTPEGFYYKGTVYLMSSKLRTPDDIARVLFHEALGHYGLRGLFGKALKPVLNEISMRRRAEVDAKIKQYGLKMGNKLDRFTAAEEVLAELAQTRPEIGIVQRAIAAIRTWLRENVPGFNNMRMSDAELIRNYILPARSWVEKGLASAPVNSVPAMSRGTNESMTDNNVVGNQGGRSADDTTPGPVNPVERVKQAAHDTFTTYQKRTGVDGDVASFSVDDNYTPVPYRAGAAAQELRNLGWEIVRGDNSSYASNDASHYFEVRKLVANDPEYGPEYVTAKVRVSNHGNTTRATDSPDVNIAPDEDIVWDIEEKLNQKITDEGYDLPVSAPSDARLGYAIATEKAQRGKPSDGSDGNTTTNESTAPDSGGAPMMSRSLGDTLTSAANSARDVNLPAGYKVGDLFNSVPGKLNWWHKTVGTQYNLAQRSPAFKRVYDAVQTFINDVSYFATEAADLAPNILPKLESWKDITKSPLSAADTKALSTPVFEGTLNWARDESGKPVKMAVLEEAAAKLTTEQKAQRLLRGDHISQNVLKMWQGLPIDQFESLIEGKYESSMLKAGIVFTPAELKSLFGLNDKQVSLYQEFRKATDKSLTNLAIADMLRFGGKDVEPIREQVLESKTVGEAAEMLRDYLLSVADENDVLIDTANKMIDKGDKAQDLMDRGYAPLSRFGTYTLDVVDANGERAYFGMFESAAEASKMRRKMEGLYPGSSITQGTVSEEAYKMFAGVSPETLELFGDMLGLESQGDSAASQAFQEYLKLAKSSRSAMKRLIQRKGIAGFSEDAGRVLAGFVYSNARQTASSLHMGEMTNAANEIDKTQGELKDAAVKLVDYIKNPREEAQALRGLLFAQYIGGSVASAMVNMTQPFTMTFPWLSQYGGAASAAKQMTAAMKDQGKKLTGDAKLDAALRRAEEDGTVSPQEVHQLMAQSQGKGALQSGDGTVSGDAMAKANNALSKVSLAWGKLFGVAEQFNRRVTFIAAYRTAIAQGMADPDGFARKAIAETQGVYNKGNKPAWARGAVGATLFTFKQYSIAYVEMLSRMAKNGPKGKKAALLALGVLFLMSGAGGMPGADDLDDLISGAMQSMGYNFDSKMKRKEFFVSILGEGGAQFMERGISGLPGVPIDVSGRMGLGNLVPGTGLFTKKADHTRDVTEIAGPAGDFVKRGFDAAGSLITGNVGKAVNSISPKAMQNLVQAADMANMGMYRDAKGMKVLDTDGYDAIAKAIGFQPNDVKKAQEANFEAKRMIDLNKINESEIANQWAMGIFEKDSDKVKDARDRLAEWNEANPESPIRINFRQIAQRVNKMKESKAERIAKTAPAEIRNAVRRELATQ